MQELPFLFIVFHTIRKGRSPYHTKVKEVMVGKIKIRVIDNKSVNARAMTITPHGWKHISCVAQLDGASNVTMGQVAAAAVAGLLETRDDVQAGASERGRE